MPVFEEIPEALRLNYYVGDIVISDSFAEHEARVLWNVLQDAGLVTGNRPGSFGTILPRLVDAFERPEVPDDFRGIALDLLTEAAKWHDYRNGLVHDLLTMGWGRGDDVHSALNKNPPRPMRQVAECAEGLRTSGYRLRGLYITSPYWLGGKVDGWDTAGNLRSWMRVAMGHIADVPNTISGTEGPSPEPPEGWDSILAAAIAAREAEDARLDQFRIVFEELTEEGED